MSLTFSDDNAVCLADTIQPAALKDLSLAALDAGMTNSCHAHARSFGSCVYFFHQAGMS